MAKIRKLKKRIEALEIRINCMQEVHEWNVIDFGRALQCKYCVKTREIKYHDDQ